MTESDILCYNTTYRCLCLYYKAPLLLLLLLLIIIIRNNNDTYIDTNDTMIMLGHYCIKDGYYCLLIIIVYHYTNMCVSHIILSHYCIPVYDTVNFQISCLFLWPRLWQFEI